MFLKDLHCISQIHTTFTYQASQTLSVVCFWKSYVTSVKNIPHLHTRQVKH